MPASTLIPEEIRSRCDEDQYRELGIVAEWLSVTDCKLDDLAKVLVAQMRQGLGPRDPSGPLPNLPMIPSFVNGLPKGKGSGYYLALDLGGTNLR